MTGFYIINYSSTHAFIGVIGAFLPVLYFIRKRDWLGWLYVTLLIFYFVSPLNAVFSLFTNYRYTRWLYGFVMIGTLCGLNVVKDRIEIGKKALIVYSAVCALVLSLVIAFRIYAYDGLYGLGNMISELILIAINFCCLFYFVATRCSIRALYVGVIIAGASNLLIAIRMQTDNPEDRSITYKQADRIYRYILGQPDGLAISGDMPSYRTDFVSYYPNNEMVLNRPSIGSFHSAFNKNLQLLRKTACGSIDFPVFYISSNREELAALLSVKNVMVYDEFDCDFEKYRDMPYSHGLAVVDTVDCGGVCDVKVFDFEYYIPMGFTYDGYLA